jgi:hypothetical protein
VIHSPQAQPQARVLCRVIQHRRREHQQGTQPEHEPAGHQPRITGAVRRRHEQRDRNAAGEDADDMHGAVQELFVLRVRRRGHVPSPAVA